jgi:hypothetical protein
MQYVAGPVSIQIYFDKSKSKYTYILGDLHFSCKINSDQKKVIPIKNFIDIIFKRKNPTIFLIEDDRKEKTRHDFFDEYINNKNCSSALMQLRLLYHDLRLYDTKNSFSYPNTEIRPIDKRSEIYDLMIIHKFCITVNNIYNKPKSDQIKITTIFCDKCINFIDITKSLEENFKKYHEYYLRDDTANLSIEIIAKNYHDIWLKYIDSIKYLSSSQINEENLDQIYAEIYIVREFITAFFGRIMDIYVFGVTQNDDRDTIIFVGDNHAKTLGTLMPEKDLIYKYASEDTCKLIEIPNDIYYNHITKR